MASVTVTLALANKLYILTNFLNKMPIPISMGKNDKSNQNKLFDLSR